MNIAETLSKRVRRAVLAKQKGSAKSLVGRVVRRNGVEYTVVKLDGDDIIVSDLKTPMDQTTRFNVKAFMSKAVVQVDKK